MFLFIAILGEIDIRLTGLFVDNVKVFSWGWFVFEYHRQFTYEHARPRTDRFAFFIFLF